MDELDKEIKARFELYNNLRPAAESSKASLMEAAQDTYREIKNRKFNRSAKKQAGQLINTM